MQTARQGSVAFSLGFTPKKGGRRFGRFLGSKDTKVSRVNVLIRYFESSNVVHPSPQVHCGDTHHSFSGEMPAPMISKMAVVTHPTSESKLTPQTRLPFEGEVTKERQSSCDEMPPVVNRSFLPDSDDAVNL